jgi:hypothetical protein
VLTHQVKNGRKLFPAITSNEIAAVIPLFLNANVEIPPSQNYPCEMPEFDYFEC